MGFLPSQSQTWVPASVSPFEGVRRTQKEQRKPRALLAPPLSKAPKFAPEGLQPTSFSCPGSSSRPGGGLLNCPPHSPDPTLRGGVGPLAQGQPLFLIEVPSSLQGPKQGLRVPQNQRQLGPIPRRTKSSPRGRRRCGRPRWKGVRGLGVLVLHLRDLSQVPVQGSGMVRCPPRNRELLRANPRVPVRGKV